MGVKFAAAALHYCGTPGWERMKQYLHYTPKSARGFIVIHRHVPAKIKTQNPMVALSWMENSWPGRLSDMEGRALE